MDRRTRDPGAPREVGVRYLDQRELQQPQVVVPAVDLGEPSGQALQRLEVAGLQRHLLRRVHRHRLSSLVARASPPERPLAELERRVEVQPVHVDDREPAERADLAPARRAPSRLQRRLQVRHRPGSRPRRRARTPARRARASIRREPPLTRQAPPRGRRAYRRHRRSSRASGHARRGARRRRYGRSFVPVRPQVRSRP